MWLVVTALVVSFLVTVLIVPRLRDWFKKIKVAQLVMRTGEHEVNHTAKVGTPTMGGAAFVPVVLVLFAILGLTFSVNRLSTGFAISAAVLIFAGVGALDDSVKIWNNRDEGLRFLPKLTAQIVAALLAILVLAAGRFYFVLSLPFGFSIHSVIVFALFLIIWLVGWSNATNLTDGLDGLASGVAIIAYTAYLILAWQQGNEAVMLFDALMIGALLGFLVFNHYPATIFMGDTGSLALGAGLAMSAVVLHLEWSLVLIGFVFMVETLTVMIQVTVYHFFKKRVFLIAPLHHSFEKGGLFGDKPWSEWHVDLFFWGLGLISAGLYFWLFN